jgi:hypothetical protein
MSLMGCGAPPACVREMGATHCACVYTHMCVGMYTHAPFTYDTRSHVTYPTMQRAAVSVRSAATEWVLQPCQARMLKAKKA